MRGICDHWSLNECWMINNLVSHCGHSHFELSFYFVHTCFEYLFWRCFSKQNCFLWVNPFEESRARFSHHWFRLGLNLEIWGFCCIASYHEMRLLGRKNAWLFLEPWFYSNHTSIALTRSYYKACILTATIVYPPLHICHQR